jgi:hypothetical protein
MTKHNVKKAGLVLIFLCGGAARVSAQTWIEDSFEDFADGKLDAGGQNLYVSRDGSVRTIHRFDLNQDGHLDLMFNSTHDTYAFIPATMCFVDPDKKSVVQQDLAVEGSKGVAVEDLNQDGWLDLVFCPNEGGIQHPRRFLTVIWGGDDGWPAHRSNGLLPVHSAKAVTTADLNKDGWPDIVTLNGEAWLRGQPDGDILRIFWGGDDGFVLTKRLDIGIKGGVGLAAADFDGDSAADAAVLTSEGEIHVLWATLNAHDGKDIDRTTLSAPVGASNSLITGDIDRDGKIDLIYAGLKTGVYALRARRSRAFHSPEQLSEAPASHVSIGDLDGDGTTDLVLSNLEVGHAMGGETTAGIGGGVTILWGGDEGYSAQDATALDAPHTSATAIGDLDGDGRLDLAVAVFQSDEAYAAQSSIYLNQGNRAFGRTDKGIETEGAAAVAVAPPEKDHPARAIFCNSRGGTPTEDVPLLVYYGGPDGFDPARRWEIPFTSGYESSGADLNADGFVDLIAINSGHGGQTAEEDPHLGANIFWGGDEGFDLENRRSVLSEANLGTSNVADLDKDGHLDVVLGGFGSTHPDRTEPLVIRYGSSDGFKGTRRTALEGEVRAIGCAIADFNRDEWLDIGVVCYMQERLRVHWGGPDGFDNNRKTDIPVPGAIDLETADLNGDGWLDILVASYSDKAAKHHDTGLLIFWGGPVGFHHWNSQRLPGFTPVGPAIADFDDDGHLDIFSPHYHSELTRESLPSYLYWGGKDGFATRRRTILICDSAHDAQSGDFDGDGLLDLAVSCHTRDGSHHTDSRVFFNDGNRFADPRVTKLPTHGTHWMWNQDMGHIYDRSWRQRYESSVFQWEFDATACRLEHISTIPPGCKLTFSIRTAADEGSLETASWRPIASDDLAIAHGHRRLQYRALFESDNGDRYPVLDRLDMTLIPAAE